LDPEPLSQILPANQQSRNRRVYRREIGAERDHDKKEESMNTQENQRAGSREASLLETNLENEVPGGTPPDEDTGGKSDGFAAWGDDDE
jgi:hypothetical protein